jgi:hypothetical protein
MQNLRAILSALALAGCMWLSAPLATAAADSATPDDTARLLAGLEPAAASPLAAFTQDAGWQRHAKYFNSAWTDLDARQLSRIGAWSRKNVAQPSPVVFYMFSGPDYLYADAFFPEATTYVLSGLEPVGQVSEIAGLSPHALAQDLRELQGSLNSVLSFSFFITKKMKTELSGGRLTGTLPILYVFLARSGKTIREVSYVSLDENGALQSAATPAKAGPANGVKIVFAKGDGPPRTLYYFSTDLSDGGVKRSGFLKFCEGLGTGDSLLKSASYLMHSGSFAIVRDFILAHSAAVAQDDSGIPVRYFAAKEWDLRPFGNYLGPISLFPGRAQPGMRDLFRKGRAEPLDFGIGYRWRPRESNLLLALRTGTKSAQDHSP